PLPAIRACCSPAIGQRAHDREAGQHYRQWHTMRLTHGMEALLAFAAALLSLRLAGDLLGRYRARRAPQHAAWSATLHAYAAATGSALAGLGAAQTAVFIAVAVVLLYCGFVAPTIRTPSARPASSRTS